MQDILCAKVSTKNGFYKNHSPVDLVNIYSSPLYVYNEEIIIERVKRMKSLIKSKNFKPYYSVKANNNSYILRTIHKLGMGFETVSLEEVKYLIKLGISVDKIISTPNNIGYEELRSLINLGVDLTLDSLDQLQMAVNIDNKRKFKIRINSGIGLGHSNKVVTGGKNTKFGFDETELLELLNTDFLTEKIDGLMHHMGSLFLDEDGYIKGARKLLEYAKLFNNIKTVDFGGGFGVSYNLRDSQNDLNIANLSYELTKLVDEYKFYDCEIRIEPGRYIVAESCILLGKITSKKVSNSKIYVGCDIGFNQMPRTALYGSYHDLEFYSKNMKSRTRQRVNIVGNICESGDYIATDREFYELFPDDIIGVLTCGAYGYSMSSNYNMRFRPAEIMILEDGSVRLIRRREELDDFINLMEF